MEEVAVDVFCHLYTDDSNIDTCIDGLKQNGFSQLDAVNALVIVLDYTVVDAERIVKDHPVWQD